MDKYCKKCDETKNINEFYIDNSKPDGRTNICKVCEKLRSSINTKDRRKTIDGRAMLLLKHYKHIDKNKGVICDLDKEFLIKILSNKCVYCNGEENIGADRMDNTKGHIKTNVTSCCIRCNIVKGDEFSFSEMIIIGETLKKVYQLRNN